MSSRAFAQLHSHRPPDDYDCEIIYFTFGFVRFRHGGKWVELKTKKNCDSCSRLAAQENVGEGRKGNSLLGGDAVA